MDHIIVMKHLTAQQVEERVSDTFSIPKELFHSMLNIHLIGNKEMIIENYTGIVQCDQECICIASSRQKLFITGKKLKIHFYTNMDMKIIGNIIEIRYE